MNDAPGEPWPDWSPLELVAISVIRAEDADASSDRDEGMRILTDCMGGGVDAFIAGVRAEVTSPDRGQQRCDER